MFIQQTSVPQGKLSSKNTVWIFCLHGGDIIAIILYTSTIDTTILISGTRLLSY